MSDFNLKYYWNIHDIILLLIFYYKITKKNIRIKNVFKNKIYYKIYLKIYLKNIIIIIYYYKYNNYVSNSTKMYIEELNKNYYI